MDRVQTLNGSRWLDGFLDDASTFPPSSVPLDAAVGRYRAHQQAEYARLVGSLVVPDLKIADLIDVLDDLDDPSETALPVTLLVTGGAGAVASAVRWACRSPLVELSGLELALRNEEDLAHNAQRFVAALEACEDDVSQIPTSVLLPGLTGEPTYGWLAALDVVAGADLGLRLRADAGPEALSSTIDAALDRELPMRCSGVPSALTTGEGDLGFVNLLRAVRGCLDGEDVLALLREPSVDALLADFDTDGLQRARRWLTGVSTPNLLEAHDGLVEAGLVQPG